MENEAPQALKWSLGRDREIHAILIYQLIPLSTGWPVLHLARAAQPPAQDAPRRHPPLRDEAAVRGGLPAPRQRPHVRPHVLNRSMQ